MPKPRIRFPEVAHFETQIPVQITDINYGGHLSHDKVLSIAFEARCRFYRHFGFEELNIGGVGTIMSFANIRYTAESTYGDVLIVRIALTDLTDMQFELIYELRSQEKDKVIALVETGIVAYDYQQKKVARIPETFRSNFI